MRDTPPLQSRVSLPQERAPSPALLARFGTTLTSAQVMRTVAVVTMLGVQGFAFALLVGGSNGPALHGDVAAARVAAAPVPDRLARGVVQLSLDAQPVPLPPLPPGMEPPPPLPEPRLEVSPPPAVVTRVDTSPRPAPRNEGWLKRVLRSGRAYSPASDRFPADTAGIGR
ncbi:MAG: hypothetical protein JO055_04320 [Alphaproteobacteria bacterium]|nr:hypothetical protein [Alphaproteobacteria bacterium]